MAFAPGDLVHVAGLGKGTVREARNSERYLVDLKGRAIVTTGDQLTLQEAPRKGGRAKTPAPKRPPKEYDAPRADPPSFDLHGKTVAEAIEAVSEFLNGALLAGNAEVRIIHGRRGGKIKSALQAQLKTISSVRRFRLDPRNPGVTIVEF